MSKLVSRHQVRWTKVVIVLTVFVSTVAFEARRHDTAGMQVVARTVGEIDRSLIHSVASLSEVVTLIRYGETR